MISGPMEPALTGYCQDLPDASSVRVTVLPLKSAGVDIKHLFGQDELFLRYLTGMKDL